MVGGNKLGRVVSEADEKEVKVVSDKLKALFVDFDKCHETIYELTDDGEKDAEDAYFLDVENKC